MKICSKCGMTFEDKVHTCPRCNEELEVLPEIAVSDVSPEELKRMRRKDWAYILVGTPLFLLLIYFCYSLLIRR